MSDIEFDPFSTAMHTDPYSVYARLREECPVHFNARTGLWSVSRYHDVVSVTQDWKSFSSAEGSDTDDLGDHVGEGNFLDEDPPLHDELRDVVRHLFSPRALTERLEAQVRDDARGLIKELRSKEVVDLAQDFAWAIPANAVCALLGLPREDRAWLGRWAGDVARREPDNRSVPTHAIAALREMEAYIRDALATKRSKPADDLLSVIATGRRDGRPLGEQAVGMALLLMVASIETSASLIPNGLLLLAEHPEQRRWLLARPDHLAVAIEEMLRFESPVQHLKRTTTSDLQLYGTTIPKGSKVLVLYGSANRDHRQFVEAERFDIRREPKRHLAFGNGIHHCLGAPLARLEGRIALDAILSSVPEYEVVGPVRRFESHMDRALDRLPAVLDERSA